MGHPIPLKYQKNLIGNTFGRLTVISEVNSSQDLNGSKQWVCKCECGNEKITTTKYLVNSEIKNCGCFKCMPPGTSKKYLTIVETVDGKEFHRKGDPFSYYVKCSKCGSTTIMTEDQFRNRSYCELCGDSRYDYVKEVNTKHGNAKGGVRTKLLGHFTNMHNKSIRESIEIDEIWSKDNFNNFSDWSYANGYKDDISMSLIRKDVDDIFTPDNCMWISYTENAKRKSTPELIDGKSLFEWTIERLIDENTIADYRDNHNNEELLSWLKSLEFRSRRKLFVSGRKVPVHIANKYIYPNLFV